MLAKATIDGKQADIWSIGTTRQSGENDFNAQRILANTQTEAFTFNHLEGSIYNSGMGFANYFGNTNGTIIFTEIDNADALKNFMIYSSPNESLPSLRSDFLHSGGSFLYRGI